MRSIWPVLFLPETPNAMMIMARASASSISLTWPACKACILRISSATCAWPDPFPEGDAVPASVSVAVPVGSSSIKRHGTEQPPHRVQRDFPGRRRRLSSIGACSRGTPALQARACSHRRSRSVCSGRLVPGGTRDRRFLFGRRSHAVVRSDTLDGTGAHDPRKHLDVSPHARRSPAARRRWLRIAAFCLRRQNRVRAMRARRHPAHRPRSVTVPPVLRARSASSATGI